jgi:hypothetical protein
MQCKHSVKDIVRWIADERIDNDDITESHLVLHWFMGVAALQDFFRRAYPSNLQTEIFQIGQCVDYRFVFVYSTFSLNDINFKHSFLIFLKTKFWFDLVWSIISNKIYVSHKFCNAGAHYAKPPKPTPLSWTEQLTIIKDSVSFPRWQEIVWSPSCCWFYNFLCNIETKFSRKNKTTIWMNPTRDRKLMEKRSESLPPNFVSIKHTSIALSD